ncbi:MAG: hypothetical protein N0E54_03535 [Candidatus Thiodiazotropha taylori]|nr:hypothetical protein [Candidatus Thiodiazotropha endolucinida]MCW4227801.1 hypothetical protein [Candidatus Thiodiazotropha taylori]
MPWQDNKGASVIAYDAELKKLAWRFIDELELKETELEVLAAMEDLFIKTVAPCLVD